MTWNADLVLSYLEQLDTSNLKFAKLKLCALLALVMTAQRVQTLNSNKIDNIIWGSPVQIVLPQQLKTTSLSKPNPVLTLSEFENKKLGVASCLKIYVEATANLRKDDQLFIIYSKPYKSDSKGTLSRWLGWVLKESDIITEIYHAHSYRHASTSKANRNGVTADNIMQRVGWSEKSKTFAKH